jgi:hypothetical protein
MLELNQIDEVSKQICQCAQTLGLNEYRKDKSWEEIEKSVYFLRAYAQKIGRPDVEEMLWAAGLTL